MSAVQQDLKREVWSIPIYLGMVMVKLHMYTFRLKDMFYIEEHHTNHCHYLRDLDCPDRAA